MSPLKYGPIDQIGLIVADLDNSIAQWSATLGLGPWTVFRNVAMEGIYKGQATRITMDVAMAYQAETQIELIQQTNTAPSPYRDATGAPLLGMHHMAWLTDDLDATVRDAVADGMAVVFTAENPTTRVAYLSAPGQQGVLFELIESAVTRELITTGRAQAKTWDGSNPIVEFDLGG